MQEERKSIQTQMSLADRDRITDNISTMIDQTGYTIEEIAEVVKDMVDVNVP